MAVGSYFQGKKCLREASWGFLQQKSLTFPVYCDHKGCVLRQRKLDRAMFGYFRMKRKHFFHLSSHDLPMIDLTL